MTSSSAGAGGRPGLLRAAAARHEGLHGRGAAVTPGLREYAALCGRTLARAHARGGDAAVLRGYMGRGDVFERALCRFARAYADQNERDYQLFRKAVRDGRLPAQDDGE
ncbi:DUF2252 family protein [Cystobacter fuscus]